MWRKLLFKDAVCNNPSELELSDQPGARVAWTVMNKSLSLLVINNTTSSGMIDKKTYKYYAAQ